MWKVLVLLICSNVFMTIAWYGHLKQHNISLGKAIVVSWLIALLEYCFMIPANRLGYQQGMSSFQLKMVQEVITLVVFCVFAVYYLKEPFRWNYLISFCLLLASVWFMFKK